MKIKQKSKQWAESRGAVLVGTPLKPIHDEKRQQMTAMRGFGITFDIYHGRARNWYQSAGDVKRWADNDEPVEDVH